ncbi:hypothetical protein ACEQ8H_006982 [Pleosporales sp. CAS-2024a]
MTKFLIPACRLFFHSVQCEVNGIKMSQRSRFQMLESHAMRPDAISMLFLNEHVLHLVRPYHMPVSFTQPRMPLVRHVLPDQIDAEQRLSTTVNTPFTPSVLPSVPQVRRALIIDSAGFDMGNVFDILRHRGTIFVGDESTAGVATLRQRIAHESSNKSWYRYRARQEAAGEDNADSSL